MGRTGVWIDPTVSLAPLKFRTAGFSPVRFQGRTFNGGLPRGLVCLAPPYLFFPSFFPPFFTGCWADRKGFSSSIPCRLSGKAMARTGLRMMPTFPSPPLKFRTAGFPRYGFKAGLSDEAFPADWFAIALRTLCCHRYSLLCVRDDALLSTSVRADQPLYPRGPRSGPGSVVPVPLHLLGPIRPTRGHIPTSPSRG